MSRAFYLGWGVCSLVLAVWQGSIGAWGWVAFDLGVAAYTGWKFWEDE